MIQKILRYKGYTFESERISAHKSVAGDELEMIVNGESVWDNYTIEIILTYDYYGGPIYEKNTMEVGEWTLELFTLRASIARFYR